jgi:hypothetical protein
MMSSSNMKAIISRLFFCSGPKDESQKSMIHTLSFKKKLPIHSAAACCVDDSAFFSVDQSA